MAGTEEGYPKADGDNLWGSEANDGLDIVNATAAETIAAGNIVYIHLVTGAVYVATTGAADKIRATGIALTGGAAAATIAVKRHGLWKTTGLTANTTYYLGVAGALSATKSGVRIGRGVSTTLLDISINQDDIDMIGTIKSYAKSLTGVPANNMTAFWKECDGATLSDTESPLNGTAMPDMNSTKRFPRGSATSGTTGDTTSHVHQWLAKSGGTTSITAAATAGRLMASYNSSGAATDLTNSSSAVDNTALYTTSSGVLTPAYYEVVFVVKIK